MGTPWRLRLIACVMLLTIVAVGWAMRTGGRTERFVVRTPKTSATTKDAGSGPAAELDGSPVPAPAAGGPTRPAVARSDGIGVRFSFDAGLSAAGDLGGRLALRPHSAAGGALGTTTHGSGLAVRFPQPCAHYGAEGCPRAILESGPADFLNPGRDPFRYGATIQLAPNETSNGANVMQKGFSVGGSQFKLQVDGAAGQPSCVLVGTGSAQINMAFAGATVADGQWHRIECARRDGLLTIAVDGVILGRAAIPPALSIVNTEPLCVGGKGTSPNNDQFTGVVDDVYVTLGV